MKQYCTGIYRKRKTCRRQ